MNFVDMFCGCGGLSLGLENVGFHPVFSSDIDHQCAETYIQNFNLNKDKFFVGDIKCLNEQFSNFEKHFNDLDLVCGGPPCQGFSMANRQRLIDDPRNSLYKEYLVFLKNTRPKFFILENVKGMKNKISEICNDIYTILGKEYNIAFDLLNAKDFGVPQNRERFFIVGNRIGIDSEAIFARILESRNLYPDFKLRDAIEDLPKLEPNRIKNNTKIENDSVGYFKRQYKYQETAFNNSINGERKVSYLYNHKNRYNNDRDIEIYSRLPQGANSLHSSIEDIMPYKRRNEIFKDKYYKLKYDDVCKTITSHMRFDCNMYIHPTQARGLSPREAARVQTFPDDFIFYGPQNSWYKQIGNAVPVKLAEAIGKQIAEYL